MHASSRLLRWFGLALIVVFAIVIATLCGYTLLLSRRQREIEAQLEDLEQSLQKTPAQKR